MAQKALSKEIRSLVTTSTTAARKRLNEAHATEKLVIGGSGLGGSALAGVADHYDWAIPVGDSFRIPLAPVVGVVGMAVGVGIKGSVGAAAFGGGMGMLFGYSALKTKAVLDERADDDQA